MADKPYGCGIGPAFEVIGGKWKATVLWEMQTQPRRFGELRRLMAGISERMLAQQLRELESAGLIERRVLHVVPAHVEYSATAWGRSLNAALGPLADWGAGYEQALHARGAAATPGTP
ncbi:winged helix-turn-helix transcriptional regulator [Variovorax sp. DT-64]|uniref:winged helix-turn-helix transcriptional regulator n=1 Tax=Variovorax sp. DT-64 TaxID=3396160 RepID=UPI003F194C77